MGGQSGIGFEAAAQLTLGFKIRHIDAAGDAGLTGFAMWTIHKATTATKALADQEIIERCIHLYFGVWNQVGGQSVVKVAAFMLGSNIQAQVA